MKGIDAAHENVLLRVVEEDEDLADTDNNDSFFLDNHIAIPTFLIAAIIIAIALYGFLRLIG